MKTFTIYSLGCKVNQYDGQLLREHFLAAGFVERAWMGTGDAKAPVAADGGEDVFVLNTCTVTDEADKECARILRKIKRVRPNTKIIVTGCAVSAKDQELLRSGEPDLFVPNADKDKLLDLYSAMMGQEETAEEGKHSQRPSHIRGFRGHCRAFVKIQDGCNEFCTFCKIPYVRGRNRSRSLEDVRREAAALAESGYQEIVLTGVHAGNYGLEFQGGEKPAVGLDDLIGAIHDIPGIRRIRFSSIEPMNLTGDLIARLSDFSKVCPHFHLPMQSGDDQVLRGMRRRYTVARYREIIGDLRAHFEDMEITTDIIVGFPGETQGQFENTLRVVGELDFLKVHVFPYSVRPGTLAAGFPDRVPGLEIKERADALTGLADEVSLARRARYVGCMVNILVEGKEDKQGFHAGFTPNYLKVFLPHAQALVNQTMDVRVISCDSDGLYANPLLKESANSHLPRGY